MIDGSILRDFYIAQWRAVPDLVAAMQGGEEGWIRKHTGLASAAKSLQRAVLSQQEGSILVAYQGCRPGRDKVGEITVHEIAAYIRPTTEDADETIPYANLMIDAIPVGQQLAIRYLDPHIDADPMNMPVFERVSSAELTFDIWKLAFTISEHFA